VELEVVEAVMAHLLPAEKVVLVVAAVVVAVAVVILEEVAAVEIQHYQMEELPVGALVMV
jgi:hypothetical protein